MDDTLHYRSASDAGAMPVSDDQASVLVKALKDFILSLVHAQAPVLTAGRNANDIKCPSLGLEARQLIDTLEKFIASLVNHQSVQQDKNGSKQVDGDPVNLLVSEIQVKATAPEKPKVPRSVLEVAHHCVFNKMPIRLLTFNSDGSGIRLLDRSAIWDHISPVMEADFNKEEVLHRPEYLHAEDSALTIPCTRYAILSHTWLHNKPGEITYADWINGKFDTSSSGYQKLANFCKIAATEHGITLAWMDTICINKDSSAELDESIRSMYKWYRDAHVCITYLAQTTTLQHMRDDCWFTRGWTLQELIAPRSSKFYGAHWQKLVPGIENDKDDNKVRNEIQAATTLTADELRMKRTSISRKMQWAANRQVTREEDTAYSLMGIFNVSMSIAYGEGSERAFFRLLQQILSSSVRGLQDIANWGCGPDFKHDSSSVHISSLIPSSPKQYLWRALNQDIHWPFPTTPITLTHFGLHLPVLIMTAISAKPQIEAFRPIGNYSATVNIGKGKVLDNRTRRIVELPFQRYNVLEFNDSSPDNMNEAIHPLGRSQIILGVLNITATESLVRLPFGPCFAVWLTYRGHSLSEAIEKELIYKISYTDGIAFDMKNSIGNSRDISRRELAKHGMRLQTIYI